MFSRSALYRLLLLLSLALSLVLAGCYYIPQGGRGDDDDDDEPEEQVDDDDDVSDDDDDAASDDDDDSEPVSDDDDAVSDDDDAVSDDDDDASEPGPDPTLPAFVNDCTEQANDDFANVAGLVAADGQEYSDIDLCAGESDWYQINVPAYSWVSVEVIIDGAGSGATDFDLYEVNSASEGLQVSWSEQNYERLAVFNETSATRSHHFAVLPYNSAAGSYDIYIQMTDYHEGLDCDSFYSVSPTSETGPCNQIMQYPRDNGTTDGYFVEHQAHYSNLRREVSYLVAYAAEEVASAFPGTNPLALMDMSEDDGSTPGAMVGQLRHPEGTHIEGNDIDIAYYQTGPDNGGRAVCTQNDGYFCTGPADLLDAERTAYFMAKLFDSSHVRVIGVDPVIAEDILAAAQVLRNSGMITQAQRSSFDYLMAYGEGWPFHHHHMHFSWDWEGGWEAQGAPPVGCMLEISSVVQTKTQTALPML